MTWKRMMMVIGAIMLLGLVVMFHFLSRLDIPGRRLEVLGVRAVFPAGRAAPVADAKAGWRGLAFPGHFRFFRRDSDHAGRDFAELKRKNFPSSPLQVDLDLFAGGLYALRRAGKGYLLFCIFHRGGVNYWADMSSRSSLDFSRRAFERFLLSLEIAGERASPAVAGQIAALHGRVSPLMMQTLPQLTALMAAIFLLVLAITWAANLFSGACPRGMLPGAECSPGATLVVGGFGRRKVSACCLCLDGDSLVIYRFRRPHMKIDLRRERQDISWEKSALRYKNVRVIMNYEDFAKWRLRLMD